MEPKNISLSTEIKIRDFAYQVSDPRHFGVYNTNSSSKTGHKIAKALYDFEAESANELKFKKDDLLVIKYKQDQGWLVGCLKQNLDLDPSNDENDGLIPESYVEYLTETSIE